MFAKSPASKEMSAQTPETNSAPMSKEERYELIARVARSLEQSSNRNQFGYIDDMQREVMQQEIDFEYYIRTLN